MLYGLLALQIGLGSSARNMSTSGVVPRTWPRRGNRLIREGEHCTWTRTSGMAGLYGFVNQLVNRLTRSEMNVHKLAVLCLVLYTVPARYNAQQTCPAICEPPLAGDTWE